MRQGKATAAIVIPKNFSMNVRQAFLLGERSRQIGMLFDPSHALEMRVLQGIMAGAVMETAGQQFMRSRAPRGGLTMPFQVGSEEVTSGRGVAYNGYAHSFGGMGIQFLLMVGVDIGIGMLLLRERGVWKRMRAAPLSRAFYSAAGPPAPQSPRWGRSSSCMHSRASYSASNSRQHAGIPVSVRGIFSDDGSLRTIGRHLRQDRRSDARAGDSGHAVDGDAGRRVGADFRFPRWLRAITVVFPTRWAMDGLDAVTWRGLGFSAVALPIALMFGCALVFGALAVMRFRWEAD